MKNTNNNSDEKIVDVLLKTCKEQNPYGDKTKSCGKVHLASIKSCLLLNMRLWWNWRYTPV